MIVPSDLPPVAASFQRKLTPITRSALVQEEPTAITGCADLELAQVFILQQLATQQRSWSANRSEYRPRSPSVPMGIVREISAHGAINQTPKFSFNDVNGSIRRLLTLVKISKNKNAYPKSISIISLEKSSKKFIRFLKIILRFP